LNDCRDRNLRDFCEQVLSHTMHKYVSIWTNNVNAEVGPSGRGRNKLRTYRQFKETFAVETYVTSTLPLRHRSALAKFRCGTAPLRLETGRYENIPENLRICPLCKLDIENESHVLFHCDAYNCVRIDLISKANEINRSFNSLCDNDKLVFVLSNENMVKVSAKTCHMILTTRTQLLYK
jgi:hypothetical protein